MIRWVGGAGVHAGHRGAPTADHTGHPGARPQDLLRETCKGTALTSSVAVILNARVADWDRLLKVEVKTEVIVGDPKEKICEVQPTAMPICLSWGCRAIGLLKR